MSYRHTRHRAALRRAGTRPGGHPPARPARHRFAPTLDPDGTPIHTGPHTPAADHRRRQAAAERTR